MSKLDDLLAAEAAAAEAFEADQSAPYPDHVKISQPNRARSKVLQVRLNPGEFEAIERIAAGRGLPPSTVARERLLAMVREEQDEPGDVAAQLAAVADQIRAVADRMSRGVVAAG